MFNKFRKATGNSTYDYLIVGLGNPGAKYENTRHNAGFLCITYLEDKLNFTAKKLKFHALIGDTKIGNYKVLVMKPQTMMNLSGLVVQEAAMFYKLDPSQIVVISDDINLAPGKLRIRQNGSAGGQNGLKDIIKCLGSEEFARVRVGVGQKPHPEYDLADWVLSEIPSDLREKFIASLVSASEALEFILNENAEAAMAKFN